ncbi:hypothetical protein SUDANB1_00041 [Streptomyces sp. enrichment culture]
MRLGWASRLVAAWASQSAQRLMNSSRPSMTSGVKGQATWCMYMYQDRRHYVWDNRSDTATLRHDRGRFIDDESWGHHRHGGGHHHR